MGIKTYLHRRKHEQALLADEPGRVDRFATSWILPPPVLFFVRALISLYAFTTIFTEIGINRARGDSAANRQSFSYFTVLGYWGLAFYFAFAAAHTGSYWIYGRSWLSSWPRPLQWLHSLLYSSITVFPFLVTAVFWAALAAGATITPYKTWGNVSEHALNSVFAFFEIVIPRTRPHSWINLPALIVVLAAYLGLAYLTHATQGWYPYSFLNPNPDRNGFVAGICIGILCAMIVFFIVVRFVSKLRRYLTEEKMGMRGKFSSRDMHVQSERSIEEGSVQMTEATPKRSAVS